MATPMIPPPAARAHRLLVAARASPRVATTMASTSDVRMNIRSRTTGACVRNAIVATSLVNYTVVPVLTAVSMTQQTWLGPLADRIRPNN